MKHKKALIVASLAMMMAMVGAASADMGITANPAQITVDVGADGTQDAIVTTPAGIFTMDVYIVKIIPANGNPIWEAASDGLGGYDLSTAKNPGDFFTVTGTHFIGDPKSLEQQNNGYQTIPVTYTNDKGAQNGDYQVLYTAVWCTDPLTPSTCTRMSFNGGEITAGAHVTAIPEFPTVALPVAAVIGLVFFFQHRKRKEE
jgi:hypothetical protein